MSLLYRSAFYSFLAVLMWSCNGSEKAVLSAQDLQGRWELVRSFRNHRETKTLSGTYFLFSADGKLTTNLPIGPEEPQPFEITQSTIQHQTSPQTTYEVLEHTDSTLVLALSLRGMQFELHLRRVADTLPEQRLQ